MEANGKAYVPSRPARYRFSASEYALKIQLENNKILERQDLMIFSKGIEIEKGKKLITIRETGTGKYMFIAESE